MGQSLKNHTPPIPHQTLEHLLEAGKLKNCFECGICTASCPMNELLPDAYNPRMLVEKIYHSPKEALKYPALWLCAWCYRCYKHCPQKVKLPEVLLEIRKIAKEQGKSEGFNQALELISREIPFPASFGYICLHPERAELSISSESSEHGVVGRKRKTKAASKVEKLDQKVAIIGAGKMGEGVISGLLKSGVYSPQDMRAYEILEDRCRYITRTYNV